MHINRMCMVSMSAAQVKKVKREDECAMRVVLMHLSGHQCTYTHKQHKHTFSQSSTVELTTTPHSSTSHSHNGAFAKASRAQRMRDHNFGGNLITPAGSGEVCWQSLQFCNTCTFAILVHVHCETSKFHPWLLSLRNHSIRPSISFSLLTPLPTLVSATSRGNITAH